MLEVLIAVLVFSLGIIGLAGLLIFAIQSNHVAYLRTQATFLAHNMADRMGANPAGVWNGNYNINTILVPGAAVPSCVAGCTPADLATRDIAAWSQQLNTFLPNAKGSISCTTANLTYLPTPAQIANRPPYGGTCQMVLTWNEAGSGGAAQQGQIAANSTGQQSHTFAWVFQP